MYNHPIGSIYHLYTTYIYILPSGGLYATYHLLWEPETTMEPLVFFFGKKKSPPLHLCTPWIHRQPFSRHGEDVLAAVGGDFSATIHP